MIEQQKIKIPLLPSQRKFIESKKREVLYSGAWRAGKSRILCIALVKQVIRNPNNTVLLCRKTLESLKGTTLNTLLRGDNNDPVLPLGSYSHNKVDKFIQLRDGGRIFYRGIQDILKIRSMSLGAIGIDESIEFEKDEYLELLGRLSLNAGTRQIFMATNPGVPGNWMHIRFLKEPEKNEERNREVIVSRTIDNTFLPPDYHEGLKELPEIMYRRFALGEWIALENAIYGEFNRDKHLLHKEHGEFSDYMLGVDFGFTNPCALAFYGINGDGDIHLIEAVKQSKLLIGDIVERSQKYHRLNPVVVVDPSAPALIAEYESHGFNVKKANNSVDSGIARMQDYLHRGKFTVEPDAYEFIKEIENYCYDKNGKPVKIDDHLCFISGTKILTDNGYKSIQDVKINDLVFDGKMYNKVAKSIKSYSDVVCYRINNRFLTCTENHPIFVNGVKIPICKLLKDIQTRELLKKLNLKDEHIEDTYITVATNTLPADQTELTESQENYIETYGLNTMAKYLKDMIFTIKTSIIQTMISVIMSLLKVKSICQETTSAQITANLSGVGILEKTILMLYAQYVELLSKRINTQKHLPVLKSVQEKVEVANCTGVIGNLPVYNLTVDNSHRYTANNILVSNCDASRYVVNELVEGKQSYDKPMIYMGDDE